MGILEFHFHDCEFSPSMTVGADEDEAAEPGADTEDSEESTTDFGTESARDAGGSERSALGAVVALAVLVVLGALVKWKRGGSESVDEDDEDAQSQDVDVSA